MTHARRRVAPAAIAVALLVGCALIVGCAPRFGSRPWDAYANEGRLRVYGAPRDAPGPRIYRALASRRDVRSVLGDQGEPDTLEVKRRRGDETRSVLTYSRRSVGRPRRIVLESRGDRFVASAPQPLRTRRTVARQDARDVDDAGEGTMTSDAPAVRSGTPTREQALECPIDRQRADCRAYCGEGASYEWCR